MLKIEDYFPIDRNLVKTKWDKIMNVPNDQWDIRGVDKDIEIINNENYPYTLRTSMLNMLPVLIIEILSTTCEKCKHYKAEEWIPICCNCESLRFFEAKNKLFK